MGRKGWHSRGYLPHMDGSEVVQHVVFRLADALPDDATDAGDEVLDRGLGAAVLRNPYCAEIVTRSLMHHHGARYDIHAWCIMPNHVHVLLETHRSHELGAIVRGWKSFSGRLINAHLGREGRLWAVDYFDRYMRDGDHYETTRRYIERNPVTAGLCKHPEDWPFSSAFRE
ncbi:MAG: transposase [Hyphomonadaceae bacterium]|nr:transposase [Hyphomonadaceae bacterium]